MKVEDLQLVERTSTADIILKHFVQRERISNETTIDAFKSYLVRKGKNINPTELYRLFEDLEEAGVGELKEHQGNSRGKFSWYYSLRDISDQILNPGTKVEIKSLDKTEVINKKRSRGRPLGFSPKPKVNLPIKVDKPQVLFLFTTDSGEPIALRLSEAERLVQQISILKEKLN